MSWVLAILLVGGMDLFTPTFLSVAPGTENGFTKTHSAVVTFDVDVAQNTDDGSDGDGDAESSAFTFPIPPCDSNLPTTYERPGSRTHRYLARLLSRSPPPIA